MIFVVLATIAGCTAPALRAQHLARQHGLAPVLLQGKRFKHHAFAALRAGTDPLVLFIEGDGSPWVDGGRRIAADPTPRVPLALELAAVTPGSVLYLGRPCYLEQVAPPECSQAMWTAERYSAAVVASMSAAAAAFMAEHQIEHVLLVGYSGGGTIAALMARDLPGVVGLVSVAGNLDPDTWAQIHGYLPLEGSLNPALLPALPTSLQQWYLVGQTDANVPAAATARYLERVPPDRIWSYPRFDHACCWVGEWPAIFARISGELAAAHCAPQQAVNSRLTHRPAPTQCAGCEAMSEIARTYKLAAQSRLSAALRSRACCGPGDFPAPSHRPRSCTDLLWSFRTNGHPCSDRPWTHC